MPEILTTFEHFTPSLRATIFRDLSAPQIFTPLDTPPRGDSPGSSSLPYRARYPH